MPASDSLTGRCRRPVRHLGSPCGVEHPEVSAPAGEPMLPFTAAPELSVSAQNNPLPAPEDLLAAAAPEERAYWKAVAEATEQTRPDVAPDASGLRITENGYVLCRDCADRWSGHVVSRPLSKIEADDIRQVGDVPDCQDCGATESPDVFAGPA